MTHPLAVHPSTRSAPAAAIARAEAVDSGYTVDVDGVDASAWHAVLRGFDDACVYQTWAYGAARWGAAQLSHVVVRRSGTPVAAGQLAVLRVPLLRTGVAYLNWGPLWRPRGTAPDAQALPRVLAALREHYAERRRLLLRIMPRVYADEAESVLPQLASAGFVARPRLPSYRTLLLDLSLGLDELERRADPKFRYNLRRASREELAVTPLAGEPALRSFRDLYGEMKRRKGFLDFSDVAQLEAIQGALPADLALSVVACTHRGEPIAVQVTALLGDTATSLWAATSEAARRLRAGYLLSWWHVKWLQARGFRWYDLGGLEADTEPGVNVYKRQFAGRRGRDVSLIGKFDACASAPSLWSVRAGDALREGWQNAKLVRRWWRERRERAAREDAE